VATSKSATLLGIARPAGARQWLAESLAPDFGVLELGPAELGEPSRLLDAAGAVVVLDGSSRDADLESLAVLRGLPAGQQVILVLDGCPDGLAEAALVRLAPAQVLCRPVSSWLLRWAIHRVLPSPHPGRGARRDHRPAPALLGVSAAIRDVIEQVRRVAPSPIPVLILGETGTGKELVARAIHEHSTRAERSFVTVNCAALPDTLLESELFGHRRGAFTGADRDRRGLFEHASGGTIFLDEIGDTSPAFQAKLLRAIEAREVRPLGATQTIAVDVRVVSATHRDLEAAIEAGSFRQDLYYRLNTVSIFVPPLRRRRVDVPFLAQHFAEEFGAARARAITLGEDFLASLAEREFPGNVRELRNAVERAITLAAPGETVTIDHLGARERSEAAGRRADDEVEHTGTLREIVGRVESRVIRAALARCDGRVGRTAALLGLSRPGLRYKLRRLGLADDEPAEAPAEEPGEEA
jgi:DNA-binding NtrC family response regulator